MIMETAMLPDQKLNALVVRHATLERELASVLPPETYVKLSREFAELAPVVDAVNSYRAAQRELDGLTTLIADPSTDAEMRSIAESEKPDLEARRTALEQRLRLALLPKDAMDERNVILEIRAGTGGDEAALFAGDLFRMYERFAAKQGWKVEIISMSEGSMGGFQGNHCRDPRPRRLRQAQIRVGCASRAARARYRSLGPHPYFDRDSCGVARGAGGRCCHQ